MRQVQRAEVCARLRVVKLPTAIRTLIVDDNALFREDFRAFVAELPRLEIVGEATDGPQAVQHAAALQPDLVLMDFGLPRCNGLEAARYIRQSQPGVRIIIVTALDTPDLEYACLTGGADGYVSKYSLCEHLRPLIAALFSQGLEKPASDFSKAWKKEPFAVPTLGKVPCKDINAEPSAARTRATHPAVPD